MSDDYSYFTNKRTDRTYISKAFNSFESEGKSMRFASRVIDSDTQSQVAKVKGELVLRVTGGGRQEIKILFYEDSREIHGITIQRFTVKNGNPHKVRFFLSGRRNNKTL